MPNVSSASLSLAIPTETISAKSNVFRKLKASSGLWIPTARILFMIIFHLEASGNIPELTVRRVSIGDRQPREMILW